MANEVHIDQEDYSATLEGLADPQGEGNVMKYYKLVPYVKYKLIVHRMNCHRHWFIYGRKCDCGAAPSVEQKGSEK